MGTLYPTLPIAVVLAIFTLLAKHALDMRKEKNYREMWGSWSLSLVPAALFCLWVASGEPGNDFTRRFPPIARALTHLRCRSCIIDGEAVICDDNGIASFNYIRYRRNDGDVFLYAFDLIVLLERWGGKLLERRVDEGA
jgi:hypothetical protein